MSKRKPYVRPMEGWWKWNHYLVDDMVHESPALFVAAYALALLVGLVRLSQGEAAWNGWLDAMKSPLAVVFHLALLVAIAYHAFTWFKLFPLTMPPVVVGGKKVAPDVIVRSGFTAAIVCAVGLLAVVWRIAA